MNENIKFVLLNNFIVTIILTIVIIYFQSEYIVNVIYNTLYIYKNYVLQLFWIIFILQLFIKLLWMVKYFYNTLSLRNISLIYIIFV